MQKILSLCAFLFVGSCALISFAMDFTEIPDVTVQEALELPDNTLIFMQGNLQNQNFSDETGTIKVENNFIVDPTQKIEILARTHNTKINIITLSPL